MTRVRLGRTRSRSASAIAKKPAGASRKHPRRKEGGAATLPPHQNAPAGLPPHQNAPAGSVRKRRKPFVL